MFMFSTIVLSVMRCYSELHVLRPYYNLSPLNYVLYWIHMNVLGFYWKYIKQWFNVHEWESLLWNKSNDWL